MELRPEFRSSRQIWAILLGFRLFCLDLGPKEDKALRMGQGGLTNRFPCILQDFVPFGAAALPPIPIYNHARQGNGYP